MSDRRRGPRAPAGLSAAGRRLWRSVVDRYDLRPDELALLEHAGRCADELAGLQQALTDAPAVVAGSTGQVRAHPLYAETRAHREVLRRLLADLDVPEAQAEAAHDELRMRRGA